MRRSMKWGLLTLQLLAFISVATAASFSSPGFEGVPAAENSFTITVNVSSDLSAPRMKYKSLESPYWRTCDISDGRCDVSGLEHGVYEIYFINGSDSTTRFPHEGTLHLPLSTGRTEWKEIAQNFTDTDPENVNMGDDSCSPWTNDFSCGFEHMQGHMMRSFAQAGLMTDNATYIGKAENLSVTEYDTTGDSPSGEIYATCDIDNADFICEDETGFDLALEEPPGEERSSVLIDAQATTSRYFNLSQPREAARNYTGGQAQGCDVWGGDTDCRTPAAQGRMAHAFWESYLATGNDSVRQKAIDLSKEAYRDAELLLDQEKMNVTGYLLMKGLWTAHMMTGNNSYRQTAADLGRTAAGRCTNRSGISSCGLMNQSNGIDAYLRGYRATGEHFYVQQARQLAYTGFNGSCNPWNNSFTCSQADPQGRMGDVFWQLFRTAPDINASFAAPRIQGKRQSGTPLTVTVDMEGDIPQPELLVKEVNATGWTACSIDLFNRSCTLDRNLLAKQTSYAYRFNSSNVRFPANGSFKFILAHRNSSLRSTATNFTLNASDFCDPWSGSYGCDFTHWQGWEIAGYQQAAIFDRNDTYQKLSDLLAVKEYDPADSFSSCDQADNDFDCDPGSSPPGSFRQGRIMTSLWDGFRQTGNTTIRELAHNYTQGHAADCDVWSGDHSCSTAGGQGMMIHGFLAAYRSTGNSSYLETAMELGDDVLNTTVTSDILNTALWSLYGTTNNTTYRTAAEDRTSEAIQDCTDGACDPVNYSLAFSLGMEAFRQGVNDTYYNLSYQTFQAGTSNSCSPWTGDVSCQDPDEQGAITATIWQALAFDRITVDGNISIDASSTSFQPGDSANITCTVTNTVLNGSDLLDVNLTLDIDGFNISGNSSAMYPAIEPLDSVNNTWTVTAGESGDTEARCSARSSNNWKDDASVGLSVESPSTGDDDDDGSDTGGGGGGSIGGGAGLLDEQREINFSHQEGRDRLLILMEASPVFDSSLQGLLQTTDDGTEEALSFTATRSHCLHGQRNLTEDGEDTIVWLNTTYTCNGFIKDMLVYDTIPRRFGNFSNVSVMTEASSVALNTDPAAFSFIKHNVTRTDSLLVRYRLDGAGSIDAFGPPLSIITNHTLPPPDRTAPNITVSGIDTLNTTSNTTNLRIQVGDGSRVRCELEKDGRMIESFNGEIRTGLNLTPGWNRFSVGCTDENDNRASEQFSIFREIPDDQTTASTPIGLEDVPFGPLPYLILLPSLIIASLAYRRREMIVAGLQEQLVNARLDRLTTKMREAFEDEDYEAMIQNYETVNSLYKQHRDGTPGLAFWEQHLADLGMNIRIYLLLDMAVKNAESGKRDAVISSLDNLQNLYTRFKERTDQDEFRERLEEKARELNRVISRKYGLSFQY